MSNVETVLVRDWDSQNFREISIAEFRESEKKNKTTSAFAESRIIRNGMVVDTGMSVTVFLNYRNSK